MTLATSELRLNFYLFVVIRPIWLTQENRLPARVAPHPAKRSGSSVTLPNPKKLALESNIRTALRPSNVRPKEGSGPDVPQSNRPGAMGPPPAKKPGVDGSGTRDRKAQQVSRRM